MRGGFLFNAMTTMKNKTQFINALRGLLSYCEFTPEAVKAFNELIEWYCEEYDVTRRYELAKDCSNAELIFEWLDSLRYSTMNRRTQARLSILSERLRDVRVRTLLKSVTQNVKITDYPLLDIGNHAQAIETSRKYTTAISSTIKLRLVLINTQAGGVPITFSVANLARVALGTFDIVRCIITTHKRPF